MNRFSLQSIALASLFLCGATTALQAAEKPRLFVGWRKPIELGNVSGATTKRDRPFKLAGLDFTIHGEKWSFAFAKAKLDGNRLQATHLAATLEADSVTGTVKVMQTKRVESNVLGRRVVVDVPDVLKDETKNFGKLSFYGLARKEVSNLFLELPPEIALRLSQKDASGQLAVRITNAEDLKKQLRDSVEKQLNDKVLDKAFAFTPQGNSDLKKLAAAIIAHERPHLYQAFRDVLIRQIEDGAFETKLENALSERLPTMAPVDHDLEASAHFVPKGGINAVSIWYSYPFAAAQCEGTSLCILTDKEGFRWTFDSYLALLRQGKAPGPLAFDAGSQQIRYPLAEKDRAGVAEGLSKFVGRPVEAAVLTHLEIVARAGAEPKSELRQDLDNPQVDFSLTLRAPIAEDHDCDECKKKGLKHREVIEVPVHATFQSDFEGVPHLVGLRIETQPEGVSVNRLGGFAAAMRTAIFSTILSAQIGNAAQQGTLRMVSLQYFETDGTVVPTLRVTAE